VGQEAAADERSKEERLNVVWHQNVSL